MLLQPEICRNYVAIDNKSMLAKQEIQEIQRTAKDTAAQHGPKAVPRGIPTVLASKQRYRKEHDQVEYGMKVDVSNTHQAYFVAVLLGNLVPWPAGVCILVTLCRGLQVYAFGITMYEMLVHAQPWQGSNSDDIFRKVRVEW